MNPDINSLSPNKNARRPRRRVGRGPGSGTGKTAGRGHNGQKSRSGGSIPAWFEGGQNPLYRRVPKRGFKNFFRKEYNTVNLQTLDTVLAGEKYSQLRSGAIDLAALKKAGFNNHQSLPVKILGASKGYTFNILKGKKISAHKVSKKAEEAMKAAGIELEIIEFKPERKRREHGQNPEGAEK